MMQRIQALPKWGRMGVFALLVLIVVGFFGGLTVLVMISTARSTPRTEAIAILSDEISVREFAVLPDDDSYPPALALASDGTLFTGSYASGAVWRISPDGDVSEIAGTREAIGSVTGLDIAPDGSLYILDRIDPLIALGGVLWRWSERNGLEAVARLSETVGNRTRLPDDVAVDGEGNIYISDRGTDEILRVSGRGDVASWWVSPRVSDATAYAPTGLAYDARNDSLIITDSLTNFIYEVPVNSRNAQADTVVRYRGDTRAYAGLDGVTVAPNGDLFVAALALNRVARLPFGADASDPLEYLAGAFRGSVDVAYDAERGRLYVANWDQRSLLPVDVLLFQISIDPHLPFAIDVIEFMDAP